MRELFKNSNYKFYESRQSMFREKDDYKAEMTHKLKPENLHSTLNLLRGESNSMSLDIL